MNIHKALAAEHSKHQTIAIVEYIGTDAGRFAELMEIFLGNEYRPTQRAAWAVNYCAQYHPELVKPYLNKLVQQLERNDVHNAVLRNVARLLQYVEIPKRIRGRVYADCIDLLDDPGQPVAVRAFAMTVAGNIAKVEPGLFHELQLVIERHLSHASAAFRARARCVLQNPPVVMS